MIMAICQYFNDERTAILNCIQSITILIHKVERIKKQPTDTHED